MTDAAALNLLRHRDGPGIGPGTVPHLTCCSGRSRRCGGNQPQEGKNKPNTVLKTFWGTIAGVASDDVPLRSFSCFSGWVSPQPRAPSDTLYWGGDGFGAGSVNPPTVSAGCCGWPF
ncbi:MAG: hypothetical protein CM15mP79_1480 [Methanobacteriota archaeon]|nr:MAG: hypothetical protein CM15mP79_1480 [Euryarchaeota archaeon]